MGMTHSTARWATPLSFAIDFAAQQYGMLSTPNMKVIHDKNMSFWSPQPFAIAGFFFPQQIFQVLWLFRLYKLDPRKSPAEKAEVQTMVDFAVPYCVGNLMIFWNSEHLKISNVFVLINSFAQLYYIFFRQPAMNISSTSSILTHVVSKTFACIGVLDLLHNGSVAYFKDYPPTTAVRAITGAGFMGVACVSDWIFGGCLVYDLVGLAVGQRQIDKVGWSNLLGMFAVGTVGIVGLRNWVRPPYVKFDPELAGYEDAAQEDNNVTA